MRLRPAPPPARQSPRRLRNLAIVGALGLVLGVGVYLGYGIVTAPGPEQAPGWELLDATMPVPRGETAVAVAAGRLYVAGGLTGIGFDSSSAVSVFDSATETWAAGPSLPEARHHAAAAAVGGDVYVSGGAAALADGGPRTEVWVLRGGAADWVRVASLPEGRFGHRMVEVDRLLYVVGGIAGSGVPGAPAVVPGAILIYDPVADSWSTGAPIPVVRDHLAVAAVDGEIWAIGGRAGGQNHVDVNIYDPATDAWRAGPPLPEATSGAAEGVVGGRILLSGGEDPGAGVIVDRHWLLDARAGNAAAWLPLAAPPLTVHGVPGAVLNGRFIIVGGSSRPGGQSNTAWTGATQVLVSPP